MILTQRVKIVFQCIIAVCSSGESYYDYIYGDFLHCWGKAGLSRAKAVAKLG